MSIRPSHIYSSDGELFQKLIKVKYYHDVAVMHWMSFGWFSGDLLLYFHVKQPRSCPEHHLS